MKKIITTLAFTFILLGIATAQEYRLNKSSGKLIIREVDRVDIEGTNGSEIIFESDYRRKNSDGRAEGLKPINGFGLDDNTGIGLSVVDDGNEIEVRQISSSSKARYTIKVPKGVSVLVEHSTYHGKAVHFKNVKGEIEVSLLYNKVYLEGVTGPMAIKTVYGGIEAEFSELNQSGSISLYSVYDFVDVTIPPSSKANVTMSSPYGEMFTNIKIDLGEKGKEMRSISSKKIRGTINGGGVDFNLKSSYKNIYLRKK